MNVPSTMQWIRQAVQRVATGSLRLAVHLAARAVEGARAVWRRAKGWLGEGSGLGWLLRLAVLLGAAALIRKVAAALAVGLYERVESGALGWLLWTAAALWVISAYRVGRDGWEPKRRPEPEPERSDEDDEQGAAEVAPSPVGPPPVSPVALVAAVRDIGTPHAQLKPLAEHLATTTDQVRAAAARLGWAVKDVRMQGRSASAGLRWDEVPSPPPGDPAPGVVGAGEPADDNDDDTSGEGPGEGFRVQRLGLAGTVVHDPAETVRHHKVVGK